MRRAPSHGKRIGSGRLRVDAARAISKLREYQLPDRTAWILEAVRAAVAADAERIELRGDANDVWLHWKGQPWDANVITQLLNELVSPEPARTGQKLRLLATAINSALGLDPAFVDVYSIHDEERAVRVRYSPEVLTVPDDDSERPPLELISAEDASPPVDALAPGMLLHLRRRAGLETLGYFFRGQPPELALAREACTEVPTPMQVGDAELGVDVPHSDIMRLELGRDLDGFIALIDPQHSFSALNTALMQVAERGVVVASYPIPLIEGALAPVPLRVFVNADRMPTNASRSDVRRDAYPIREAEALAHEKLPELCNQLAEALRSAETRAEAKEALRTGALALVGAVSAGPAWERKVQQLPDALEVLGELPLLHNALGEERAIDSWWDSELVHLGREPYPKEYGPWLDTALWIRPGDVGAGHLVGPGIDGSLIRRRAKQIRKEMRAQRRFHKHERRLPKLDQPEHAWIRVELSARLPGSCSTRAELEGEVCLLRWGYGGELVLLVDEREIEDVAVDTSIPFRGIVADPAIQPHPDYRRVIKDNRFFFTQKSVRMAAVRAAEALALALEGRELPPGFELLGDVEGSRSDALLMVRRAIRQAQDLQLPIAKSEAFMNAPVWRATDGTVLSLAQMRELPVIGTIQAGTAAHGPEGRLLFEADESDRQLLRQLLEPKTAVVHYDPLRLAHAQDRAHTLARTLVSQSGTVAVALHADGMCGAVAWGTAKSTLRIYHMGVCLEEQDIEDTLGSCTIAVDCDAIIPSSDWTSAREMAGVADFDYRSWEYALAKAVGMALAGDAPPQLVSNGEIDANSFAGRHFFTVMSECDAARDILGEELIEALRARPLFRMHSDGITIESASEFAAQHSGPIPYLTALPLRPPPEDWAVLVADAQLARGLGWLVGRKTVDGSIELEARMVQDERHRNMRAHRQKPVEAVALPEGTPSVEVSEPGLRGVVGAGYRDGVELHLMVESRTFHRLTLPGGVPLRAVVDLDPSFTDPRFRFIPDKVVGRVRQLVDSSAERLLVEIIARDPHSLSRTPANRALMVHFLRLYPASSDLRDRLRQAEFFPTIQGGFTSLATIGATVRIARWTDEWLRVNDGEEEHLLDRPVIAISDGQTGDDISRALAELALGPIEVVTDEVYRLQTQRRVDRGLVPMPTVSGVEPEFKRSLLQLEGAQALGSGEIALADSRTSRVTVFRDGSKHGELEIDVLPRVTVAIESLELAADLDDASGPSWDLRESVANEIRPIAWRLAQDIASTLEESALPEWLRRNLACALLAGEVDNHLHECLAPMALFNTTRGSLVSWRELEAQASLFGDVWYVVPSTAATIYPAPLDERREAITLSDDEMPTTFGLGMSFKEASKDLALDEQARKNRNRPLATTLALGPGEKEDALAIVELKGDGISAPRGLVAPLRNTAGKLRGAYVHREMQFLGMIDDPCSWPTVAVVDDARLEPNRTWSEPVKDVQFRRLCSAIRSASENALTDLIPAPQSSLTSHWVGRLAAKSVDTERDVVLRGRVWLEGPPDKGAIVVQHGYRETFATPDRHGMKLRYPLPINGLIMVHPAQDFVPTVAIGQVCNALYPKLLRQLVRRARFVDGDVLAAHLAYGLALRAIAPDDVGNIEFSCFRPRPLLPKEWSELFASGDEVALVGDEGTYDSSTAPAIIDDGSFLARTVIELLGDRLGMTTSEPSPSPDPVAEAEDEAAVTAAAEDLPEQPVSPPAAQPAPHPLTPLAAACRERLTAIGIAIDVAVVDSARPMVDYARGTIHLAGRDQRLRELHRYRQAEGASADCGIDLLVAHIVTVLNSKPTHVTDAAEEHALLCLLRS